MSAFEGPLTPPSPPASPAPFPLRKKPRRDVVKYRRSTSPPSIFLNVPQKSAAGLLTPPDTPVKRQHTTGTTSTTVIDCPISKASFLLAQASLATQLFGGSSTTEFKFPHLGSHQTLRFGAGLDGCFNRIKGFLGGPETQKSRSVTSECSGQRLPASLEAWEVVHRSLPRLLRAGRVRQAVDALSVGGRDLWNDLEQRHLARAALVLSALAHAYMFGEEKDCERSKLPRHVLDAWEMVCAEMGRPITGRVPADDVLNNAVGNGSFSLRSTYFDLPEERLSSGLQGSMEAVFAPALSTMALAQSSVLADQPGQVAHCLESLAARVVKCAQVLDAMTPRDTAHFDPVIWIKTYPAMGRAVTSGELGNSGVDVPLFHALDIFIGRRDVKGDLSGMQNDRRAALPANIRVFLDALGDEAGSVRDYVAAARDRPHHLLSEEEHLQYQRLSAAWDGLLQMYVWFLERHRVKAVGITGVSLGTGRHSTSSGVKSSDQGNCVRPGKPNVRPEAMLSMQMKKGMASRLGGRPLWQDAHVQSRSVYQGSVVVAVRLDSKLPLQPGDRVQVWPPRKRKKLNRTSSQQRRLRAFSPEDDDVSSDKSDDDTAPSKSDNEAEPRFYSIARVMPDVADGATDSGPGNGGGGMTITLTVGQHSPEGLVSSFLSNAAQGTPLRLRPWPSPRFRQPRDLTLPLVLVGQSSGVGPLLGFLHDRAAWAQRLNDSQHDVSEVGEVLLVVAARTLRHVPCSLDSLEKLTQALPLTIVLALSQETHLMIRGGTWSQLPGPKGKRRVTRHLVEYRDFVQRLVKEKDCHVFVCGSSDFGSSVMNSLGLGRPQQQKLEEEEQQQAQDGNTESCNHNHTQLPSPPPHWSQLHQDLFTTVKRSSSSPTGPKNSIISPSTLAAHNSIDSCWTAIGGTVYDMTPFLSTHPGGPKTLLESAGTVADERFAETHGGPHAQEIRGYLENYAIGRLSTTLDSGEKTRTATASLMDSLVRMQNALTNNMAFDASRGPVPLYVYEDALLVFADGLDGMVDILSDVATDDYSSELETIATTQARLKEAFTTLKERCKKDLSHSHLTLLDESEVRIHRLYMEPSRKVHATIDAFKEDLGEIGTHTCNEECADALKRGFEKFCTDLAGIAIDLLDVTYP
ncbi:hypothetical protein CkaCkLH20_05526 [Colletotrichum karsti]|uniref:Cytochrome b5-like Heme/Steroid binding domain-containing protein n=1 Tax=Colletotrichum karsti TaxID=1095194 RepID=A0A9P6LLI2_9PEZI|nr:uncharacterized protein CkaCkLH20_05526 [Colletotrichum karsti]KAF9877260.1 hypothetical protein CkaCkLH20_05526 [Colletotrichum karsti]